MVVDTVHQAGGGAGENQRRVGAVQPVLLAHLKAIYRDIAGSDQAWGPNEIKRFIQSVQQHGANDNLPALASRESLDFNGFLDYMTSSHAAVTKERKNEDLSHPLASYFISSSHNTYLSGNQLSSDSTTETYTNVLLRGCRCVEIDVWDGDDSDSESSDSSGDEAGTKDAKQAKRQSALQKIKSNLPSMASKLQRTLSKKVENRPRLGKSGDKEKSASHSDGAVAEKVTSKESAQSGTTTTSIPEVAVVEPRVLHGYTLTKEISFREVCTAIREHAFTASDLPLIVSLEVHCGPQQQIMMVNIMKEVWGEYLVPEPDTDPTALPSPAELRKKILIKVKYAPPGSSPTVNDSEDDDRLSAEHTRPNVASEASKDPAEKPKKSKITQELSKLGVFTKGISFKSFTQPEASIPTHIFSLAEKKFLDYHENHSELLFKHNRDFLIRAYPSGLRIRSSNLNPPVFWGAGGQIVALNWQQTDEGMMLNEGMFSGTDGYVLKPQGYRGTLKPETTPDIIIRKKLNLKITLLAAQSIPLPVGDTRASGFEPYIKVELHVDGSKAQLQDPNHPDHTDGHEREGEYKARSRTHRGCNVDFSEGLPDKAVGETLVFEDIPAVLDELTFVRFTVRDDEIGKDDIAAWACVRLDRLGEGYRFLHLIDLTGQLTEGVVLVKVEKTLT